MPQPLSFTELEIAITKGDLHAFQDAVERAKSALADLAKSNPQSSPLEQDAPPTEAPPADLKVGL